MAWKVTVNGPDVPGVQVSVCLSVDTVQPVPPTNSDGDVRPKVRLPPCGTPVTVAVTVHWLPTLPLALGAELNVKAGTGVVA